MTKKVCDVFLCRISKSMHLCGTRLTTCRAHATSLNQREIGVQTPFFKEWQEKPNDWKKALMIMLYCTFLLPNRFWVVATPQRSGRGLYGLVNDARSLFARTHCVMTHMWVRALHTSSTDCHLCGHFLWHAGWQLVIVLLFLRGKDHSRVFGESHKPFEKARRVHGSREHAESPSTRVDPR